MKNLLKIVTIVTPVMLVACSNTNTADNSLNNYLKSLSIVKENHAVITENNEQYILDTYIQPFSRPYFINVVKQNGTEINDNTALKITKEYIKPRGCTTSIENESIFKKSSDKKQIIIKLEC